MGMAQKTGIPKWVGKWKHGRQNLRNPTSLILSHCHIHFCGVQIRQRLFFADAPGHGQFVVGKCAKNDLDKSMGREGKSTSSA